MENENTNQDFLRIMPSRSVCLDYLTDFIKKSKDHPVEVMKLDSTFAVITEEGYVFLRYVPFLDSFSLFEHKYETKDRNEKLVREFEEWFDVARYSPQNMYDDYEEAIRKVRRILKRI